MVTGGQLVARMLKGEGVRHVFTLSGLHVAPIYAGLVEEGIAVVDLSPPPLAAPKEPGTPAGPTAPLNPCGPTGPVAPATPAGPTGPSAPAAASSCQDTPGGASPTLGAIAMYDVPSRAAASPAA